MRTRHIEIKDRVPQELIQYNELVVEINKQIAFYENSSNSNDFEKWCNQGAIRALNSLKDNIGKLIVR